MFNAVHERLLASLDERVSDYQTCLKEINPNLGFPDGTMTFRHLANQTAGYHVTEAPGDAFVYRDVQLALFYDTLMLMVYRASGWAAVDGEILRPKLAGRIENGG